MLMNTRWKRHDRMERENNGLKMFSKMLQYVTKPLGMAKISAAIKAKSNCSNKKICSRKAGQQSKASKFVKTIKACKKLTI